MPDGPTPEPADAASLFDTDEVRPIQLPTAPEDTSGGYDLEVDPFASSALEPEPPPLPTTGQRPRRPRPHADPEPESPSPPRPTAEPRPKPRPTVRHDPDDDIAGADDPAPFVDPVWTRGAEWGPDLVRVGASILGTLLLVWLTWGHATLVLLILALGAVASAYLAYPILVTLERPVRITPEQAVEDFFAAASHHFPHYRRMWLLLSPSGRTSGRFFTYEAFRDHWRDRVARWRERAGVGKMAPLQFAVSQFQAEKSTGKLTTNAEYTLHVLVRGRVADGPVESFKVEHGLVKGPDRMWYLDGGRLPQGGG